MLSSFAQEYESIVKQAGIKRVLQGGALGAAAAGLSGNEEHAGEAMLGGALLGTGVRGKGTGLRFNWRVPAGIGAVGAGGYLGTKALTNQNNINRDVTNQYTAGILSQPASSPGPWR